MRALQGTSNFHALSANFCRFLSCLVALLLYVLCQDLEQLCVCVRMCVCVCVCVCACVYEPRAWHRLFWHRDTQRHRERDTDAPERAQARAQTQAEGHLNHLRVNEDAVASLLEFGENTVEDIELTADAHPHLRAQVPLFFQKKK